MMKTYSPKLAEIKRSWYVVDAKGQTLGKMATKIAEILRGKNKPTFSPHLDCGDFVIVINAREIHMTGKKMTGKTYHHHTRRGNGLRETTPQRLMEKKPERIIMHAVAGMIPHTKLKKDILKKLKVYPGSEHKHSAQEPKPLHLNS
jgi:large subunit ribosomal protein L13